MVRAAKTKIIIRGLSRRRIALRMGATLTEDREREGKERKGRSYHYKYKILSTMTLNYHLKNPARSLRRKKKFGQKYSLVDEISEEIFLVEFGKLFFIEVLSVKFLKVKSKFLQSVINLSLLLI